MPDGDKFCWGVKGTGSRTLLNLIRSGAALGIVADQGAKVITGHLKKPVVQRLLRDALRILEPGLPRLETDCSVQVRPEDDVRGALRRLRSELAGDDFAAVALRSAEYTYDRLRASGRSFSRADLERELGNSCVTAMLGYAVFDTKRSELMHAAGRSANDELIFERALGVAVGEWTVPNFERVFEGRSDGSLRAPRRRSPREDFTLEKLYAPLATVLQ